MNNEKIDVNAEGEDQRTPLHIAAIHSCTEVAAELMQHKDITIDAVDKFGKTAHHCAAFHGDAEYIKILVKHGADLTIKDNTGDIVDIPTEVLEELFDDCILWKKGIF